MPERNAPGSWVIEAMETGGVDLSDLADRLPAAFEQLLAAPDTLSPDDLVGLLDSCASMSGDADFGLHMADYLELTRIGTYGYLLLNAPTVREFLELAARYYALIYQGGRLGLTTSGALARYQYAIVRPCHVDPRHLNEWTMGYFARYIRARVHPEWTPRRAAFANPPPDDQTALRQSFGADLAFNAKLSFFDFDRALLDTPITAGDPVLLRIISHHADGLIRELGKRAPFKAQVRLLIMEGLEHEQAKAEVIARKLNMSLSSFKRRMLEAGLDFRALRDGIVKDLSQRALAETNLPLGDIAMKMGYSELSAFTRAFRRLTRMPPLEYRRAAKRRHASR